MERIKFYDILKGEAIWIVAFEHSLLALDSVARDSILSNAIQLIQMPLFVAISGFFFYPSITKNSFTGNLKRKFLHLYLPSLCWGIIGACMMFTFKIMTHKEIDVDYLPYLVFTGMWFLTALFILSVIGLFLYRFIRDYFFMGWVVVFVILYFTPSLWMVNEVKFLLPFFVTAIFLRRYDWQQIPLWLFITSLFFYGGALYVYNWNFTLYSMSATDVFLSWEYLYMTIVRVVGGISGIISVLYLSKYIEKSNIVSKCFSYIGGITLPIYVLHQKFLLPLNLLNYETDNLSIIFITSIVIVFFSVFAYKLMKHKFFRWYLFGETKVLMNK